MLQTIYDSGIHVFKSDKNVLKPKYVIWVDVIS